MATNRLTRMDQICTAEGKAMIRVMILATPMPATTPMMPPDEGHGGGLDEELQQDVFAARAEGLADADFAGALGDRRRA